MPIKIKVYTTSDEWLSAALELGSLISVNFWIKNRGLNMSQAMKGIMCERYKGYFI